MSKSTPTHRATRSRLSRPTRALALGSAGVLCASLGVVIAAGPAQAADPTLYVRGSGSDDRSNTCLVVTSPCASVQAAVNRAMIFSGVITIDIGPGTFTENTGTAQGLSIDFGTAAPPTGIRLLGAGANQTTIKPPAGVGKRVLGISGNKAVTIEGLTLTGGGLAGNSGAGGGILAAAGSGALTVLNSSILANLAGDGGPGATNNTINGVGGQGLAGGVGGGIAYFGSGAVRIENSTIAGNRSGAGGPGGRGGPGTTGTRATANALAGTGGVGAAGGLGGTGGHGAGLYLGGGTLTVLNSTFTLNTTGQGGAGGKGGPGGTGGAGTSGGLLGLGGGQPGGAGGVGGVGATGGASGTGAGIARGGGTATLIYTSVSGNATGSGGSGGAPGDGGSGGSRGAGNGSAGVTSGVPGPPGFSGGIAGVATSVTATASLLANLPNNCDGALVTPQASAATDQSCFTDGTGAPGTPNKAASAVGNLAAVAFNGGPTPTVAPAAGNPAIGLSPCYGGTTMRDQRGLPRPGSSNPKCTAGAYEPQGAPTPPPMPPPPPPTPPTAGTPPTMRGVLSSAHPKTRFNWYRDTVVVTFTCSPGTDAIAYCPPPLRFTSSGLNQGATVTARDAAGRTTSIRVSGINVDKTKPKITIKGVTNGKTYSSARQKIRCAAADTFSGVFDCKLTASAKVVKRGKQVQVKYKATAIDKAGNVSTKSGQYFYKR